MAIGGQTILLAVLGWLAKSLVQGQLQKDLERFKATLQAEADAANSRLRHQLEVTATEHRIRFSQLHQTRAKVIANTYSKLVRAHWAARSFVSPGEIWGEPDKKEKYIIAMNAITNFYRYFDRKKIYLPEGLCKTLDEFVSEMRSEAIGFGVWVLFIDENEPGDVQKQKFEAWVKAWKHFDKKTPVAKAALESELRQIIGNEVAGE